MLAGVTIVDPASDLDRRRRRPSRPTPSSTRSPCCAARRRSPPAPRSARTRSRSTPRSARARSSGRSVTFALAPFSRRGRRRGHSWRSRTRASARGTKVPHLSYIGDADIGEDTNIAAGNVTANFSHEPGTGEGPDDDRQERQDRCRQYVRCSGHGWGRCLALRGNGRHGRRPAGIARRLPAEAGDEGRMGLRAWKARETMATTELATPAGARRRDASTLSPSRATGIERGPQKRLMVFAGRSHPDLAHEDRRQARRRARRDRALHVRERRDLLPLRRVDPRRRRLPRPDRLRAGGQEPDGAAGDDPGREARLREADHRRRPALSRTRARTARRSRASRSPRASSPTCSSSPAPTAC